MTACGRCGAEVRFGQRGGVTGFWHREETDHAAALGHVETPDEAAERERQRHVERYLEDGTPYTTAGWEISKIKDRAKREAAEADAADLEEYEPDPIPEPEVTSTPIEIGDDRLPAGAKSVLVLAARNDWDAWATYSRGPRVHGTTGKVLEVSDFVLVRARSQARGQVAVASWLTKNDKPAFEFAYLGDLDDEAHKILTTPINSRQLKALLKGES